MLNFFGLVRSGENIIGSVRGRGHKIYYFSVRSGSGQKITGQYGVGVPKTLPRRTLVWSADEVNIVLHVSSCRLKLSCIAAEDPVVQFNAELELTQFPRITKSHGYEPRNGEVELRSSEDDSGVQ